MASLRRTRDDGRVRTVTRHRERASAEREVLNQILDDGMVGTLSTVTDDGMPWAVPLLYARDGDRILVHGSTGAGALRRVATGAPVAFSVTHMDAMVVAHSTFESSANYRSAVVYGVFEALSGDEQYSALDLISEHIIPGRTSEVPPMIAKEQAATLCMQLRIVEGEWVTKVRNAWSDEPETDEHAWCGIVPMTTTYGAPQPAPWSEGQEVPESVRRLSSQTH